MSYTKKFSQIKWPKLFLLLTLSMKPCWAFGLESIEWDQASPFQGLVSLKNRGLDRGLLITDDEPEFNFGLTYLHPKRFYLGAYGTLVMGGGEREAEFQYMIGKAFAVSSLSFNLAYHFFDVHHSDRNNRQHFELRTQWKSWHYTYQSGLNGSLDGYQKWEYEYELPKYAKVSFRPSFAKGKYGAGFLDDHQVIGLMFACDLSRALELKISYSTTDGLKREQHYWMLGLDWRWSL